MAANDNQHGPPSDMERIKETSNYLRGTIVESLNDAVTGAIAADDQQLTKFHGTYQQDDRDARLRRQHKKLEPAFTFMVRVGIPGGLATADQWIVMDDLSVKYANNTLKLTTRQAFQLHGVLKSNLWAAIHEINAALMTSIAACGDVCRNTMATPNPDASTIHQQVYEATMDIARLVRPQTNAYHEIWVDDKKVLTSKDERPPEEVEPLYLKHYLPRKFKIGLAIPPHNDIDVFSQDLGMIAIAEGDRLVGFNLVCGGGMGMSHGKPETYPNAGTVIGFCTADQLCQVTEQLVTIQRDFGDRSNRQHARFKYTIDDRGIDWLIGELNSRLGWQIESARPYAFESNGDSYGWLKGIDGAWYMTLFIENGRVRDAGDLRMKTGLRKIAELGLCDFRLTGNQNLILGKVASSNKKKLQKLLDEYGITAVQSTSAARLNSMACASLPYCGLAMAESERYLPDLMTRIETMIKEAGIWEVPITIRMTGCPNGCARPYLAEIAFVGKSPGHYNVYLGAGFTGDRLNKLYREGIDEETILQELEPLIKHFAAERLNGEHFGDFVIRAGYVKPTTAGLNFHD